ncbi:MAG: protein translocase subunit SecD [Verrucomicrobiales bacterium]
MTAYLVFSFGLAVLTLFFFYFGADADRTKRRYGTILSIVVSLFCLYVFVAPKDGRLIETLTQGDQRGEDGRLFGNVPLGIDLKGGSSFTVRIDPVKGEDGTTRFVDRDVQEQARAILEKRLNAFGTVDMAIIPQGEDRLEIQMPGVRKEDFDTVRQIIQKVARLEFRLVHPRSAQLLAQKKPGEPLIEPGYIELPMLRVKEDALNEADSLKKRGLTALRGYVRDFKSKSDFTLEGKRAAVNDDVALDGGTLEDLGGDRYIEAIGQFKNDVFQISKLHFLGSIVVRNQAAVSGKEVANAYAAYDARGWTVRLGLNSEGAKRMSAATTPNVGQPLAIKVDNEIISAPVIRQPLSDNIEISGSFSEREARDLASALNNPLENPLQIINENSVTSSFGADTIKQGILAGVAGLAGILLFMMLYYRAAGLIALIGLLVNTIILFGFMAITHSTLTMLGIAGIILTIGMGVDANVLIYERLREELKLGKPLKAALPAAYDRAFSAIFDGHMTSLITAVILFWLGGGTIKGFAVSLTIGILASLFGSLLVTRTLFAYFPNLTKLNFLDLIKNKKFDFMGASRMWVIASIVLTIGSLGLLAWKRGDALGVDLRGGDKIIVAGHANVSADDAESAARSIDRSAIVQSKNTVQGGAFLEVRTAPGQGNAVLNAIEAKTGEDLTDSRGNIEKVGPQIGKEMLRTSILALVAGVIGIMFYLTLRFEFAFSLGALAGLFHDLIFCVGLLILTGRDLNLLQVGALLTIAGYSVNDTVVIFDRIREYFATHKGDLRDIMNDAISSTLSRTLLTSVCTLITVVFLFFMGGPALSDFSFTIFVGILIGTYSSIFIASPVVLWWVRRRQIDLRKDVLDAAAARALAQQGVEREVAPRKL